MYNWTQGYHFRRGSRYK